MYQADLFEDTLHEHIVNVASVPQRSPFRYPGGKTWLVPRIRRWLRSLPSIPAELIEPFAGGGIVSLTVAAERLADHATMVELDLEVAAVWHTIVNGGQDAAWLAERIATFDLTHESAARVLSATIAPDNIKEQAFRTILKNRVNRGGILAPGAGLIKEGENGKGIRSRWYPATLRSRILDIVGMRNRLSFLQGDGLTVMHEHAQRPDVAYFIDPPYTVAGKRAGSRLYAHSELDHEELFKIAATLAGDFLMTYDYSEELCRMAGAHGFDYRQVAMKNTHHAKMTELLIGRDLSWLDRL